MTQPAKINYKVYQGSTFSEVLRWETSSKVYVPITTISNSAPMMVTALAHGAPAEWRTKITGVIGMKETNTPDHTTCTETTPDTLTYNQINSLGYGAYTSGGVLEYNKPVELLGYTAKMQVRSKLESTETILELSTQNGGVILDNTLKTIRLYISSEATALLNFSTAVYSLELSSSGNEVITLIAGSLSLVREVTR